MHAVLQNDELLTNICDFVLGPRQWKIRGTASALLSLALVCRDISCIALPILWRAIDLQVLCFTFPEDIVSTSKGGKKSWNLAPITPDQWSRFDIYARYIHHITLTALGKGPGIDGLFDALGRYPHLQNRFPRLERLTLQNIEASRFRDAAILLCPTLTDVTISLQRMDNKGHRDVADFLRTLDGKSTFLQNFACYDDHDDMNRTRPAFFFDTLTHLIRHSTRLRTVNIPLSRNTLVALAQLPFLTRLELDDPNSLLAGLSEQMPEIGITQNEQQDKQDTFVSLENLVLSLEYPWPSDFFKGLFQGLRCDPKAFEMRIYSTTSTQLEALEFDRFLEELFSQRQNSLPRNVRLEDFSVEYHDNLGCTAAWRSFHWLLSLPNLQHVHFHGLFFDITDLDLEEITKMWPNLRSLQFTVDSSDQQIEGYQSQVTFAGLAHLAKLPELRHLCLILNTGAEISSTMLSTISPCTSALATFGIKGKFPKVAIIDATLFFAKYFPNLKQINAEGSEKSRRQWGTVKAGLHSVHQTLASLRNA